MSSHDHNMDPESEEEEEEEEDDVEILNPDEAAEEIADDDDAPMSDDEDEIALQNDSTAHFDLHTDSIFCIAQHPKDPSVIATGGGDDVGYVFQIPETPVLPWGSQERESLQPIFKLEGHTDSLNAITFTSSGNYLVSAGLDGRLQAYSTAPYKLLHSVQEVEEINWLIPGPKDHVALGANDGSVWVYSLPDLTIVQAFYLHTESCTAGAWSPDGKLLATTSEDGSFYVWDAFGEAAAAGLTSSQNVVGLTAEDQRFSVEGGLYSVAISPNGALAAVGGAGGNIKVVGMPRLSEPSSSGATGTGARSKGKGGKQAAAGTSASSGVGSGQAGQILAALQAQSDGIETLSFAPAPLTLLAAGSVDGSIALFDTAHRFAVRRHIKESHDEHAVVKVQYVNNPTTGGWLLTSAGMDGVVRRWDTRGGTAAAAQGLVGEWKGHRGDGEGGGVLGFVQGGGGSRIVTAGDDGVSLVFNSPIA
jgi:ribosome assembly protein SQT1